MKEKEVLDRKTQKQKRRKRILLYVVLAISFAFLCVISVYFILQQLKNHFG